MAWDDLGRIASEENSKDREKWIGVYIAVLAVMLAICSMGGGNAAKDATIRNIEAANTWAFFQAKNMRRHVLRVQVDELDLQLASNPNIPEAAKAAITSKIADYNKQEEALTRDPEKPEGQREGLEQLYDKGKALEAARDVAMRKDPYFDYAQALLQIAIVLASVAIISRHGSFLLGTSALLALLGVMFTFNGFTLMFALPMMN